MADQQVVPGGAKLMTALPVLPNRTVLLVTLLAAFVVRILLYQLTDLSEWLQQRPETSTPINAFKSLLEAHFMHHHPPTSPRLSSATLISAYFSGTIHHSPLYLVLLSRPLQHYLDNQKTIWIASLWSLVDVAAGYLVFDICSSREMTRLLKKTHIWPWDTSRANRVAALYLFNPYTIGTCLATSTALFENLLVLLAIHAAIKGFPIRMAWAWAGATLVSLYPALLLPMLVQLCIKRAGEIEYEREAIRLGFHTPQVKQTRRIGFLSERIQRAKRYALFQSIVFCPLLLAGGVWFSRLIAIHPGDVNVLRLLLKSFHPDYQLPLSQGWEWTRQVYGVIILATDLTPNLGLWWYFFIEIFDHFRDFFLLTFNVHVLSYVMPIMIKYRQDPLFGMTILCGVIAIFKSYPTVADHALFVSLLSLHDSLFEYMRYPLISVLTYLYCTFLSPAFHHLWLTAGSGNANFFFAITLVWTLGGGMLILDVMWAWGQEQWEKQRPPLADAVQTNHDDQDHDETNTRIHQDQLRYRVVVQV